MTVPDNHADTGADGTTAETHARLDLEHFLPYRLSVLSNRISQSIADTYAGRFGIAITEWRVIAVLGRHVGLSASGVAERTAMDKVAVSRALARLLERGLVQRDTHGTDRRRSVLELSEAGYRIYDEVVPLALARERALLAHFEEEDRQQLDALLSKLSKGLQDLMRHDPSDGEPAGNDPACNDPVGNDQPGHDMQ